jgi:hypothetical protein
MPGGGTGQGFGRVREAFGTSEDDGAWDADDEGTWGMGAAPGGAADSADAAADSVFPGMMPLGATGGQGQDRDRSRQAWMAEDEDVWGTGEPVVPPVISQN